MVVFVGDARLRAGAAATSVRGLATDLPPAAGAFCFGAAFVAFVAALPRDEPFFTSAASSVFARFVAGVALVFLGACAACPRFTVFAGVDAFPSFPAFAVFLTGLSVSAACVAMSTDCAFAFFRPRLPAFNPAASTFPSIDIPAGNTDSSVRIPAASSRFCAAVSRFTQYSARDAIDRSGSGNDASTARGLRERV